MKKTLKILGIGFAVVAVSAALAFGLLMLVRDKNVEETGNILGVEWYNPEEFEFTISTVEELYEFAALSDFYTFEDQTVKLDADLVVNEGNAVDWILEAPEKKWKPISKFAGTFDGQGHTISGLYGRNLLAPLAMFVNSDNSATITNFSLVNTYFKNAGSMGTASISAGGDGKYIKIYTNAILDVQGEKGGGIASHVKAQATFDECWFDGTIVQTGRYLGGLVGSVENGRATIKHCLVTGTLTCLHDNANRDGNMVGGLIGSNSKTATVIISDTLANDKIVTEYNTYVGTMLGVNYSGGNVTMDSVYDSVESPVQSIMNNSVTAQAMKIDEKFLIGEKAYQWTTLDFDKYWAAIEGKTPVLKHFADNPINLAGIEKAYDISWYSSGVREFTLSNLKQLYGFYILSCTEKFEDTIIKLGADIVVNSGKATDWKKSGKAPENPWFPIGNRVIPFNGTFDGQGHTISGIYLNTNQSYNGFFGAVDNRSTIKNLKLTNCYFDMKNSNELFGVGGLVGESRGLIDSVYVDVILDTNAYQVGGIAGRIVYMDGSYSKKTGIINSWFAGEVHLSDDGRYAGGLAGYIGNGKSIDETKSSIDFEHCLSTGLITCSRTSSASVFDASVSKGGQSIGGLIGQNNGGLIVNVNDCLYAGRLELLYGTYAGAVIGRMSSKGVYNIKNTYCVANTYFLKGKSNAKLYEIHADATANGGAVLLPDSFIKGYNSYTYTELDFNNYWAVVVDGTPILKQFATKVPSLAGRQKMVDTSWYKENAKELTIKTVKELYGFWLLSSSKNFAGQTIKLGADIALNPSNAETVKEWMKEDGTKPANQWLALNSATNPFAGTFDGQGHTISGLYLALDQERNGFFSATAPGSMIKNFKLVDGLVYNINSQETYGIGTVAGEIRGSIENVYSNMTIYTNGYQLGGIAGRVVYMDKTHESKLQFNNVWFDGSIIMKDDGRNAGGFTGYLGTGSGIDATKGTLNFTNCLSTGYIFNPRTSSYSVFDKSVSKGGQDTGGLFGATNGAVTVNVSNTLNASTVEVTYGTYAGSFIGRFKNKSVFNLSDVYSITDVLYEKNKIASRTHYEMQDTAVVNGSITILPDVMLNGANGYKFTNLDFTNYWAAIEDEIPVLKSFATGQLADISQAKKMLDTSWYNPNSKILIIDSVEDLYGFWQLSSSINFKGQTIKLAKDIEINTGWVPEVDSKTGALKNAPSNPFLPINSNSNRFAGTFDGQGHTISGLYMDVKQDYAGFFGATDTGSVVKDFRLEDSYFDASNAYESIGLGPIAGETRGKIDSVYTNATILAIGRQIGGIVGRALYTDASFSGPLTLDNCWFDGAIYLKDDGRWSGGIAGYVSYNSPVKKADVEKYSVNFENCLNSGYISSTRKTSASTLDPNTSFGGQYIGGLIAGTDGAIRINITESLMSGDIDVVYNTYVGAVISRINHSSVCTFENTYALNESYELKRLYNDITETGTIHTTNFKLINKADAINYYAYYSTDLDYAKDWMAVKTTTPILRCLADGVQEAKGNADWYKKNESPYIINIPEEFDGFRILVNSGINFKGETVKLGADIVMDSSLVFSPIGVSNTVGFDGTFDGQGHTISGININLTDTRNVGLFGYACTNSDIKNFTLTNSTIVNTGSGSGNTGIVVGVGKGNISGVKIAEDVTLTTDSNPSAGFIGIFDNSGKTRTISNCWFAGNIHSSTTRSGAFAGRVYKGNLNIENCLNTGNINASGKVGGFVGSGYGSEETPVIHIKNSLDMGTVSGTSNVGVIVGSGAKTEIIIENVYTTNTKSTYGTAASENANPVAYKGIATVSTKDALTGNNAYKNTLLDLNSEWQVATNGTPELRIFATGSPMTSFTGLQVHKGWYYNGYVNSGASMVANIAEITCNADMRGFMEMVNVDGNKFTGITVKLAKSLTFNKANEPWTKIGKTASVYFDGTFDGQGYTLSGIYLNDTSSHTGLFGYVGTNSVIKNFVIKDSSITGSYNTGAIVGVSKGNISGIYVASDVEINCKNDVNAGGFIGIFDNSGQTRTIENCWFAGTITSTSDRVAGVAGRCYKGTLNIKNCLVTGTIISRSTGSNARAGGVIGNVDSGSTANIENVIMSGIVRAATTTTVGSVVGRSNGKPTINITKVFTTDIRTDLNGNKVTFNTTNATNGFGSNSTNDATIKGTISIVNAAQLKGLNGVTLTGFDFCSTNYLDGIWVATEECPKLAQFAMKEAILNIPGQETLATRWYHEGVKTDEGIVYTLSTAADMYGFARYVNLAKDDFNGAIVKLDKDIDFNEGWVPAVNASGDVTNLPTDVNVWAPIGDYSFTNGFNGTFDGQGHTIRGVYVNHSKRDAGLFGITNTKAIIKNFVVENSYIKGTGDYNGVVSGTFRGTLVENIKISDTVTLNGTYACGGIVGMHSTNVERKISGCWFAGHIFANDLTTGGILGRSYAGTNRIENCLVTGTITNTLTSASRVGAFVGASDGSDSINVTNSMSIATLNVSAKKHVGDVIGRNTITCNITNAYVANTIRYTGSATGEFDTSSVVGGTVFDKTLFATKDASEVVPKLFENNTAWTAVKGKHPVLTWTTK